jgi:TolA-binding protein
MKFIALLSGVLLASLLSAAEPSAFGAGALDSANPYGLTESERSIVENRQVSLSNQKLIRRQALKIEQMQETIEGLRSVIESISAKIGKTGQKLSEISAQSSQAGTEDIDNLQSQIDALKKSSENNYRKIQKALNGLTSVMDAPHKKVAKKIKKKAPKKVKKTNGQLIKSAVSDYRAKRYTKAKEAFTTLADKNYKPAETNYYLGEIAYYRKNYDEAIYHFKKSVGYYDQASYMPTLLLHTALSFQELGDNANAQRFFDTILSSYPESAQANIAEKYLN